MNKKAKETVLNSKERRKNLLNCIIAIAIAIVFLFPIYWLVAMSFKSDAESFGKIVTYYPHNFTLDPWIENFTDAEFLKSLGVRNYDVCMVTISENFQNSLETTSLLKELGASYVVSMAKRDVQEKFLLRNGADEVVYPEKQVAKWAAIRYSADHLLDYVELDDEYSIFEVEVPLAWIGKTVGQIDIRKKYNINIMAFRQNGKLDASVSPDTLLTDQITLLVLGEYKALQKCFKI